MGILLFIALWCAGVAVMRMLMSKEYVKEYTRYLDDKHGAHPLHVIAASRANVKIAWGWASAAAMFAFLAKSVS